MEESDGEEVVGWQSMVVSDSLRLDCVERKKNMGALSRAPAADPLTIQEGPGAAKNRATRHSTSETDESAYATKTAGWEPALPGRRNDLEGIDAEDGVAAALDSGAEDDAPRGLDLRVFVHGPAL